VLTGTGKPALYLSAAAQRPAATRARPKSVKVAAVRAPGGETVTILDGAVRTTKEFLLQ